ncbi:Ff.00g034240.m01.CDS01 [Fusarium sp. VM40]|nr:Ff.00g034240.m01.CDS01 [Fusarium sp. VM40]
MPNTMMKSPHHSSIEKREPQDAPPPVADASGSKTPVRQQNIPHQAKTPSSHKSMAAKQATPSLTRDRETGPYIRFKKPCYKTGATSAPFDRTSAEERPKRTMDLPNFTYSQKPLMNFESNDAQPPKDAPKGPRADQFKLRNTTEQRGSISSSSSSLPVARPDSGLGSGSIHHANALAAAIKAQAAPEIARRHLGGIFKIKVMELCLSLKDEYLAMNPAPLHYQEPFWSHLLEKLESNSVTRGKFKVWKEVKEAIDHWCQPRRTLLREGNLPPVSPSQPELDGLIDS